MQQLLMRVQQQETSFNTAYDNAAGSTSGELMERARAVLAQVPPLFRLKEAVAARPRAYDNALDAVLLQELARYNALITLTNKTLQVLQVAPHSRTPALESFSRGPSLRKGAAFLVVITYAGKPRAEYSSNGCHFLR